MSIKVFVLSVIVCIPFFCFASSIEITANNNAEQVFFFGKNKWVAAFLALLTGGTLGLHRWYMGHYKAGLFHVFCFLFTLAAITFLLNGTGAFPIIFIANLLIYIGLEVLGHLKQAKNYLKNFQNILLALTFIPLAISALWIGLIVAFSGRSVYLILFTSIFALFSLFLAIRYAIVTKRGFIERFYKNRSIWH